LNTNKINKLIEHYCAEQVHTSRRCCGNATSWNWDTTYIFNKNAYWEVYWNYFDDVHVQSV